MEFLRTKRLTIRKFRDDDFADFYEYARDAEMSRMMNRDLVTTPESAMPVFLWLKDSEPRGYALVLTESGRLIGNLTVREPSRTVASMAEVRGKTGKALSFSVSRSYRRRGLMTEALEAVIGRLFSEEDVDYVNCGYLSINTPSRKLQEKLGFAPLVTEVFRRNGETLTVVEQILLNNARRRGLRALTT